MIFCSVERTSVEQNKMTGSPCQDLFKSEDSVWTLEGLRQGETVSNVAVSVSEVAAVRYIKKKRLKRRKPK